MADNGSHSGISTVLTIWLCNILLGYSWYIIILIVGIVNFIAHLIIDAFPHGHFKNKIFELAIGGLIVGPFIFWVMVKQPILVALIYIPIGVFFGNVFDFLLLIAGGKKSRWARIISNFNLWIHWFVRKTTFLDRWGLIQKYDESREEWKGQPVYSLKFGWYNLIPITVAISLLIVI